MLPLTELGNRLKEARLTKGLSLDDLQTITKIQKRYLIGIEEGNYDVMPGKFYVRAFIKQYAEAVHLDPEELFDQYKDDIPTIRNEELPEQLSRVKSRKTITESNPKVFAVLPTLLVVVFVVGALGLLYYFLQNNAGDDATDPVDKEKAPINVVDDLKDKEKEEVPVEEEKEEEPAEEPAKEEAPKQELTVVEGKGAKSTYELKNAAKFELKVATTGETWIQIKNGKGFSFFQGMLKKGATESQTFDLSKETEAIIVVGRTNDTEIYVNGQKLEYAVPPTEVVRQDITVRFVPPTQ